MFRISRFIKRPRVVKMFDHLVWINLDSEYMRCCPNANEIQDPYARIETETSYQFEFHSPVTEYGNLALGRLHLEGD